MCGDPHGDIYHESGHYHLPDENVKGEVDDDGDDNEVDILHSVDNLIADVDRIAMKKTSTRTMLFARYRC